MASFRRKLVLVLFTPFRERTEVLATTRLPGSDVDVPDVAFAREDLTRCFGDVSWRLEEGLSTRTQYGVEHVFYLQKGS